MSKSVVDKGPWHHGVTQDGKRHFVQSEDFGHDVRLYIDGDFAGANDKERYAKGIATQLNAAPVETPAPAFSVGVHGVGVIDDNPSALAVYFNAAPNDDDIRALHEIVSGTPVAAQEQPEGVTLDGCLETLFRLGEYLGVDYAASRKSPGAPSDVYIKAIEEKGFKARDAALEEAAVAMEKTSRQGGAMVIRALKSGSEAQPPVSGADGLKDAAIENLAQQYECHTAPGFKGFARAIEHLVQLSGNPGQLDHLPDATKMVEPSGNARHLADNTRVGILADSSYINGLRTGYVLGQAGNEAEYQKIIGATRAQISEARADSEAQPSGNSGELPATQTQGMTLGQRIAHVGGRENAQGYVEFGSPMAVHALIQHVLRDFHRQGRVNIAPAQQDAGKADAGIEAAAKALAECMDYPWEPMPEQGRDAMRKHVKTIIDAARKEQA